ncbi:MAG: anion permease [Rhodospirillales bacterium]|nr:anion permease [Rhodospirillales bacterium]
MTTGQIAICVIVLAVTVLFIRGRWRYDLVAFGGLMAAVAAGLIPARDAFSGFGHPAVITVLAVLVISRALANAGAVDMITRSVVRASSSPALHIAVLAGVAGLLSAFMNNVAALALLLPVALQSCARAERSPAMVLMPLSFGSILGGLATMIGTPPNVIIAQYRADMASEPFGMFDFTPVGAPVAVIGIVFVAGIGWRLLPASVRKRNVPADLFAIDDYLTEASVSEGADVVDMPLHELDDRLAAKDAQCIALVRGGRRLLSSARYIRIRADDVLLIEAAPEAITEVVNELGVELVGAGPDITEAFDAEDIALVEAIVPQGCRLEGHTPSSLRLGSRYGLNLLAVSRQGRPVRGRLRSFRFEAGDVLLIQGEREQVASSISSLGCLPLAERDLHLGQKREALPAIGLFAAAIAASAAGLAPITVSFSIAMLMMVLLRYVRLRELYETIDWPVLVLLGAMIPLGGALEASGTTTLIANQLLALLAGAPPMLLLTVVLVITMTLSDIMNNAATAIVMAPIAVGIATALGVSTDAFLMAVAIGASCAFLTPIGHQNNTLIMGPGGYRFGDYWRMGLPLQVIVVAVSVGLIAVAWPL